MFAYVDIDECIANNDTCDSLAECKNTDGSYECICPEGYKKDENTCEGRFNMLDLPVLFIISIPKLSTSIDIQKLHFLSHCNFMQYYLLDWNVTYFQRLYEWHTFPSPVWSIFGPSSDGNATDVFDAVLFLGFFSSLQLFVSSAVELKRDLKFMNQWSVFEGKLNWTEL